MPIYKGLTKIGAIYKGTTPIARVYKGTTLVFSAFTWENYLYLNLFNGLIPETVNSKSVKNKARVNTIYGNSVVENQLVNTTDTSITLGTHKYLTKINGTWSIITGTSQTISVSGGSDMVIDLTQMFPFDTPTSLTDNRIQKLLNSGYIPYNAGEIKSVDIGEFSSKDSNDTDLDTLSFRYQSNGVNTAQDTMEITDTEYVFTKNVLYTKYTGSTNEDWSNFGTGDNFVRFACSRGSIKESTLNLINNYGYRVVSTAPSSSADPNAIWVSPSYLNVFIPSSLNVTTAAEFKTYLSTHNLEITAELATPQVIRIPKKHLAMVDLGSLNWSYDSRGFMRAMISQLSTVEANWSNLYCSAYLTSTSKYGSDNKTEMSVGGLITTKEVFIKDSRYTDAATFKSTMSGQYLFYETDSEVADIDTQIQVESGGSLTSDSIVLPDVMFDFKCR